MDLVLYLTAQQTAPEEATLETAEELVALVAVVVLPILPVVVEVPVVTGVLEDAVVEASEAKTGPAEAAVVEATLAPVTQRVPVVV